MGEVHIIIKKGSFPLQRTPLTELLQSAGVWLSERWSPERLYSFVKDLCRSRTMGQMAVGGKMCILWSPSVHSGFTWDAQRLCSWNEMDENVISCENMDIYFLLLNMTIHLEEAPN
jgi:hypothetical protein